MNLQQVRELLLSKFSLAELKEIYLKAQTSGTGVEHSLAKRVRGLADADLTNLFLNPTTADAAYKRVIFDVLLELGEFNSIRRKADTTSSGCGSGSCVTGSDGCSSPAPAKQVYNSRCDSGSSGCGIANNRC
jgi:hypothetical protein